MATSPSQAWAILNRHARDDIVPLRLKELCTDTDRVNSLVEAHTSSDSARERIRSAAQGTSNDSSRQRNRIIIADFSRQRMTLETLNHLLRLADAVDLKNFITTLAWGQNCRFDPLLSDEDILGRNKQSNSNGNLKPNRSPGFSTTYTEFPNLTFSPTRVAAGKKQTRFAHVAQSNEDENLGTSTAFNLSQNQSNVQHANNSASSTHTSSMPFLTSPSMHIALRVPSAPGLAMLTGSKTNVLREIQTEHQRVQHLSDSIRHGQWRGISGHLLTHVIVVGRGVYMHGIEFIFRALEREEKGQQGLEEGISDRGRNVSRSRVLKFCSSLDPSSLSKTLAGSHPEHSCIISVINNEAEDEDLIRLTRTLKQWLHHGLAPHISKKGPDATWGKHLFVVSGDETFLHSQDLTKRECTFLIPEYARCAAFSTTSVAGLLPLAIAFGWPIVLDVLNGCHDLDSHFIETNPRHNLPVLLALVDAWNDGCLANVKDGGERGRVVVPFMQSFGGYPSFCASVESQVCIGRKRSRYRKPYENQSLPSGLVVDGGGSKGTYDQILFQCGRTRPNELIIAMESQIPRRKRNEDESFDKVLYDGLQEDGNMNNQDRLMSTFFSHADVLAFGSNGLYKGNRNGDARSVTNSVFSGVGYGLGSTSFDSHNPSLLLDNELSNGNRPSSLLICGKCDAFTCGQLIALAEHRAIVSALLWGLENSFAFTQSHGSCHKMKQVDTTFDKLQMLYQRLDLTGTIDTEEEDDDTGSFGPKLSISSTSLLAHYATSTHDHTRR